MKYLLMSDTTALSGDVDEPAKKQHEAPEYLEKRRGRRRSTPGFIAGTNLSFLSFYASYSFNIFYKKIGTDKCVVFLSEFGQQTCFCMFYYRFYVYLKMLTHITDFAF